MKKKKIKLNIKYKDLDFLIKKIDKLKVLVIGELILDEYIFTEYLGAASKEEIAVMNYKNNKTYFGGAFPIAKNVSEFCNNTTFLSCGKVSKEVLNNLEKK